MEFWLEEKTWHTEPKENQAVISMSRYSENPFTIKHL